MICSAHLRPDTPNERSPEPRSNHHGARRPTKFDAILPHIARVTRVHGLGETGDDLAIVRRAIRGELGAGHEARPVSGLDGVAFRGQARQFHVLEILPSRSLDRDCERLHTVMIAPLRPGSIRPDRVMHRLESEVTLFALTE